MPPENMGLDDLAPPISTAGTPSEQIESWLADLVRARIQDETRDNHTVIRSPAGLFFVRGDRAETGERISNEVKASFDYWDTHASNSIDILFPGWKRNGEKFLFDHQRFLQVRKDIETKSRWRFSGETDLILFNFDYDAHTDKGEIFFQETILLPVEAMLCDKRISSIDALMHQIIEGAHTVSIDGEGNPIWQISDEIGFIRCRRLFWEKLKKFILRDLADCYHHLKPFAVQDISIAAS